MKRHRLRFAFVAAFIAGTTIGFHEVRAELRGATGETAVSVQDGFAPRQMATKFAALKREQLQGLAEAEGMPVPGALDELLRAIERDDWPAASNLCVALQANPASGLQTTFWQPVLEAYGFQEQVQLWHPELLALYAETLLAAIPEGSIYLGGTDPGRFIVTAYREVRGYPDFTVITQNALADNLYMAYLRHIHAPLIRIPTPEENNQSFQQYIADVQAGRIPAGAEVSVKDGRVSVQGVQGVMAINGIIARKLFEANKEAHRFLVEESYVIPWMMPHLVPEGPLMRLESSPLVALPDEVLARDRTYWSDLTARLLAHPQFAADETARKTFSKLRSAIAGLYVSRRLFAEAEHAFKEALVLCPASPEATFRLADAYMQQFRFKEAAQVVESLFAHSPTPATEAFLRRIRMLDFTNQRRLILEGQMAAGGTVDTATQLLALYSEMQLTALFDQLAAKLLPSCASFPPSAVAGIVEVCTTSGRRDWAERFKASAEGNGTGRTNSR